MGFYAIPGEMKQHSCDERQAPDGAVLMPEGRPTLQHTCTDNGDGTGTWELDTVIVAEADRIDEIETEMSDFKGITMTQAEDYIRARFAETTLDTATKVALGKIFKKMVAFLVR